MRSTPTREERREQTRHDLVDAAGRLFASQGFHATSLDAIADAAGYTKGAVYSNFSSKEDLFFAVYEQRVAEGVPRLESLLRDAPSTAEGLIASAAAAAGRRDADDGWIAAFFEFWAHVLRHPEHRGRFAELHARALAPGVDATAQLFAESAAPPPFAPAEFNAAMSAMVSGLSLERLTQPDEIGRDLHERIARWATAAVTR